LQKRRCDFLERFLEHRLASVLLIDTPSELAERDWFSLYIEVDLARRESEDAVIRSETMTGKHDFDARILQDALLFAYLTPWGSGFSGNQQHRRAWQHKFSL
jgi:hypothetical protein